jgi:hypothetical protein
MVKAPMFVAESSRALPLHLPRASGRLGGLAACRPYGWSISKRRRAAGSPLRRSVEAHNHALQRIGARVARPAR